MCVCVSEYLHYLYDLHDSVCVVSVFSRVVCCVFFCSESEINVSHCLHIKHIH